jgi:hypothetical protein
MLTIEEIKSEELKRLCKKYNVKNYIYLALPLRAGSQKIVI